MFPSFLYLFSIFSTSFFHLFYVLSILFSSPKSFSILHFLYLFPASIASFFNHFLHLFRQHLFPHLFLIFNVFFFVHIFLHLFSFYFIFIFLLLLLFFHFFSSTILLFSHLSTSFLILSSASCRLLLHRLLHLFVFFFFYVILFYFFFFFFSPFFVPSCLSTGNSTPYRSVAMPIRRFTILEFHERQIILNEKEVEKKFSICLFFKILFEAEEVA